MARLPAPPAQGACLTSYTSISRPTASLITSAVPFATVDLTEDQRTYLTLRTPRAARELAEAIEAAAVLLDKHAAEHDLCPECWGLLPGHVLTCPLIPAGPEHPAGALAVTA